MVHTARRGSKLATIFLPVLAFFALTGFAAPPSDRALEPAPAGLHGAKGKPAKASKPTDEELKLHTKKARASTSDKHDKGRERKLQKYNDKKRQKSDWKQR